MAALSPEATAAVEPVPQAYAIDNELYEVLAGSWWPALRFVQTEGTWALSFLMAITHEEDVGALVTRLIDEDDPLTQEYLISVAEKLVEKVTGRKWWVAGRLAVAIDMHWGFMDGKLMSRNVDLLSLLRNQPSRAFNVVYNLLMEYRDQNDQRQLEHELTKPPIAAIAQRRTVEEDAAAFEHAFAGGSL